MVLVVRRRLAAASGLVRHKAQVQHEKGEWQADETGDLHNRIVNRWDLEREPHPKRACWVGYDWVQLFGLTLRHAESRGSEFPRPRPGAASVRVRGVPCRAARR